jgi:hypothetical protein
VTEAFLSIARVRAAALGRPDVHLVVVPHPVGGLPREEARALGRRVAEAVLSSLR